MPLILVHPAAALPLYKRLGRYGVVSALAIGSMTPDMHYFLPFGVHRAQTHSIGGLFWFCWPIGLTLYLLFHLVLKRPLALLLPRDIASKIAPWLNPGRLPPVTWAAVSISLLIGASTHLIWDAFTHQESGIIAALPILGAKWFAVGNYAFVGYEVSQLLSTVAGFAILLIWGRRWLNAQAAHTEPSVPVLAPRHRGYIIGGVVVASTLTTWMILKDTQMPLSWDRSFNESFYISIKTASLAAMSSAALVLLAYSLLWHVYAWRGRDG